MSAFDRLLEELETHVADAKAARHRLDNRLGHTHADTACNEHLRSLRVALDKIDAVATTLLNGVAR
jgi:hypothetical protein